jgi:environmental stress-induced protein Ves
MRIIPASAYRRMPWKNGGGETIEIAVAPEGASLDGFDWRLSMARVEVPGPFSVFPGVDRTLALLDGPALVLHLDGRTETLTPGSEPLSFPADVPTRAELPEGGITDLNAMSRRGRAVHRVLRRVLHAPETLTFSGDDTFLLAWTGAVAVRAGRSELNLEAGETLHIAPPAGRTVEVVPRNTAVLYEVAFRR